MSWLTRRVVSGRDSCTTSLYRISGSVDILGEVVRNEAPLSHRSLFDLKSFLGSTRSKPPNSIYQSTQKLRNRSQML